MTLEADVVPSTAREGKSEQRVQIDKALLCFKARLVRLRGGRAVSPMRGRHCHFGVGIAVQPPTLLPPCRRDAPMGTSCSKASCVR